MFSLVSHMFSAPKLSCILVSLCKLYLHPPLKKTLLKKTVRSKRIQGCLPFLSFISRLIVSDYQFTPLLDSIIVIAIIFHVYAVHTNEVEVHNNKFEYWSYNYLGYTMSHTSTCPITYLHQNKCM